MKHDRGPISVKSPTWNNIMKEYELIYTIHGLHCMREIIKFHLNFLQDRKISQNTTVLYKF